MILTDCVVSVANVSFIVGDVEKLNCSDILQRLPRKADVVLSDLSPNVSGNWELDHAKQIYLAERALKLAADVLCHGGSFLVKAFHGDYLMEFVDKVKAYFRGVRIVKPRASRKESAEVYVVAIEFNGKRLLVCS